LTSRKVARIVATAALLAAVVGMPTADAAGPALVTRYPVAKPRGVMVTTGGWGYCEQVRKLAHNTGYELLCGRYDKDGYVGPGLRSQRHLDWGNPAYLGELARAVAAAHRQVGGELVLVGVSYSGFGVATLASHHPELRPDRLVVVDSYLDLVARRNHLPDNHETAREIDAEVGTSQAALQQRSVSVPGLARLARTGTRLTIVWSISDEERRFFDGATCDRTANAETLARLARTLGRPVRAFVTVTRHGHNLWNHGPAIVRGNPPGRSVVFRPDGAIPPGSVCRSG
jgi:pimeloyl-ACP methyl ester carboxylesterase